MKKIKITHIFDKRATRLFKESAYEKSAPEKTGLKVVTQKLPAKANVIDGKWGMGEWNWKETPVALGFKKVPEGRGYFVPIDGIMVQHVLIQKKHLDEAKWALKLAVEACGCHLSEHGIGRMQQALKNISVK